MDKICDFSWQLEPGVLDAGRPVQHVHAKARFIQGYQVVPEITPGFNAGALVDGRVEGNKGQTLNLVATDDFGAAPLEKVHEGLALMCGILATEVCLYH